MTYHSLPTYPLPKKLSILPPDMLQLKKVSMESPALDVMADFKKEHAITISSHESIEAAKRKMDEKGIRLLIAVDLYNHVHGIIKTSDISGDKPIRYIQEFGGARKDITVEDIMIPERELEVLAFQDVMHMKVGDIVETSWRHRGNLEKTGKLSRLGGGNQRSRGRPEGAGHILPQPHCKAVGRGNSNLQDRPHLRPNRPGHRPDSQSHPAPVRVLSIHHLGDGGRFMGVKIAPFEPLPVIG